MIRKLAPRVLGGWLAMLAAVPCLAQTGPEQGGAAGEGKEPLPAMVRAFLMPSERSKASLQFTVKPQGEGQEVAPQMLATADGGAAAINMVYQAVKPGNAAFELRAGEKVVGNGAVPLRPARAYTFVAWESSSGGWQVKAYADDPASPNASDRPMRVLNFASGRDTTLSMDGATDVKVSGNGVQELRLPVKLSGIRVRVLDPAGGPPAQTGTEVDFRNVSSAYLVIVPDNLGRMRPEVIEGGYPVQEVAAPVVATTAPSVPLTPLQEREERANQTRGELSQQAAMLAIIKAREAQAPDNPRIKELRRETEKQIRELESRLKSGGEPANGQVPPAAN